MKKNLILIILVLMPKIILAQSVDQDFSRKKMHKDFEIFKKIRFAANSGLYKHRSKRSVDSIYNWAEQEIEKSNSYLDFYNIIFKITDFEGSVHNNTEIPDKHYNSLNEEKKGYFPIQIKKIADKIRVNSNNASIPLGAEIIRINNEPINKIVSNLYQYYTTDGYNITGKYMGINRSFSKYYRMYYGQQESFQIEYRIHGAKNIQHIELRSVSNEKAHENFINRYSKPSDELDYLNYNEFKEKYSYKRLDNETGILTINTFVIGWDKNDEEHKKYISYLDSLFNSFKTNKLKNLIIDVRYNGGGTDPNDLVSYSYLTQRKFKENKEAWISFSKIPFVRYIDSKVPVFLRPLGVGKYNKLLQEEFPIYKKGNYYEGEYIKGGDNDDHLLRLPNENAFTGKIYLLISPNVASAGSLFAAMLAGNDNTIVVGEETMGGYYGHNGHIPVTYVLPKSKIKTTFSIVNLRQDVPIKENQKEHRGIMPDYRISQSYDDFIKQKDSQLIFTQNLIKNKN